MSATESLVPTSLQALIPTASGAVLCEAGGRPRHVTRAQAAAAFRSGLALVANAVFVSGRLRMQSFSQSFDVLELFAFVHPARACIPSVEGVAMALGLAVPAGPEGKAALLHEAAARLLTDLQAAPEAELTQIRLLADTLRKAPWRWAEAVVKAVGSPARKVSPVSGFDVWRHLKKWEDAPPPGAPSSYPVTADEARMRLARLVGPGGETRPEQAGYTEAATTAFAPRTRPGAPQIALIEAGTGIGKTLGYLAPASLWAEKNGPGLWISTYTRNLQRQLMGEIAKLYPDPVERAAKAVVRKGRENYLCLLNFEDAVRRHALVGGQKLIALALVARWIAKTGDGDVTGAGFPAFLGAYFPTREIADRRGECLYAGCPHYRCCFLEKVVRRARRAPIVIANHALVIARTAQDPQDGEPGQTDSERPVRFVFDEGHHLFDAADSGFSSAISGMEMAALRRWLRGPEARGTSRARGLEERLKDFVADDPPAREALSEAVSAAFILAGEGFLQRLAAPHGPGEAFLSAIYGQVRARTDGADGFYSLETDTQPCTEAVLEAAENLQEGLRRIAQPLARLVRALKAQLDDKAGDMEPSTRVRIESQVRMLERRAGVVLPAWNAMLEALTAGEIVEDFVDWFEIRREDGHDLDVAMERHFVDPSKPFADEVLSKAHGVLVTSATLRDAEGEDWLSAEMRTGAHHLPVPPARAHFGSPFSYGEQARVFVVRDVNRSDPAQTAAAYRELFVAAGGGALGLFTAVRTLKTVAQRLREPLEEAGISLYAQHIDLLSAGALVDLFRSEENACLLGTDALRDGVDVPGRSLRLVVFDKVPWPKPTILHKARRARFGKSYDDLITRLRLKQAFGRLIRSVSDRGCFVILEGATPSRLLTALPQDAPVLRCGLSEAVQEVRAFLQAPNSSMVEI